MRLRRDDSLPSHRSWRVTRYGVALVSAAAAIAVTHALGPYMHRNLLVFFLAGVLVAGLVGGVGPSLLAALIGGVALTWLFLEPVPSLRIDDVTDMARLAMYAVLAVTIVAITYFLRRSRERATSREEDLRRREQQLTEARLQALRMQIQPHFLFNALNVVASFVRNGEPDKSLEALDRLGALLRFLLDQFHSTESDLRSELDFVRLYLDIQRLRFGDQLRVEFDVEEQCLDARVPVLLLQPLVENAFHHGLNGATDLARLRIAASRANGIVRIEVQDQGGRSDAAPGGSSFGIGLSNLRSRLREQSHGQGRLELRTGGEGGTCAVVELPFQRAGTSASAASVQFSPV